MSSEIRIQTTVGELLKREGGSIKTGPFGTALKASEYSLDGVPLISVREIGHGSFHIDSKTPRVSEQTTSRLPDYLLEEGDIVFARKGGIERCALVKREQAGWFLGSDGIRLRAPKSCDARFLAYSFQTRAIKDWLIQHSTGSTMASLNQATIARLPIDLPSLQEQSKISAVLETFDNRVALLRETNTTLEAIAQALFKSWFVDFDPVRMKAEGPDPEGFDTETARLFPDQLEESPLGPIPKGWSVRRVEDIATKVGMGPFGSNIKVSTFCDQGIPIISGQHLRHTLMEDLSFNFITEAHAEKLKNSCVAAGDVVFTHAGNIGQVSLIHNDARYSQYVLSQRQFFLRCDEKQMVPAWITYFFRSGHGQHLLLANASQVGVPSIARPVSYLRSIQLVVPPIQLLQSFADVVDPLHKQVLANRARIESLSLLRDTLLPRLISGLLRLPEAELLLQDAA
jgi:type I restriction enzyme S subunit